MKADCTEQNIDRMINFASVKMARKIKDWYRAGICFACIERRVQLIEVFEDSYGELEKAHHPELCEC